MKTKFESRNLLLLDVLEAIRFLPSFSGFRKQLDKTNEKHSIKGRVPQLANCLNLVEHDQIPAFFFSLSLASATI